MAKVQLEDRMVNYVRNSIDLITKDTGYPVLANTLTQNGIATRAQLRHLESNGKIKSVDVEVPSTLVRGQYTAFKAYYTDNYVPDFVKEKQMSMSTSEDK